MKTLKPGMFLKSMVCGAEIMVIRGAAEAVEITCGGAPMLAAGESGSAELDPGASQGTLVGKRYVDAAGRFELLCTKGGNGGVAINGRPLEVKVAKALPSSD